MPFQEGNQLGVGGPRPNSGRKPDAAKAELKALLASCVTEQDWKDMLTTAVCRAKAGDIGYSKLVFGYKFGTPVQRQEVVDLTDEELKAAVTGMETDEQETPSET